MLWVDTSTTYAEIIYFFPSFETVPYTTLCAFALKPISAAHSLSSHTTFSTTSTRVNFLYDERSAFKRVVVASTREGSTPIGLKSTTAIFSPKSERGKKIIKTSKGNVLYFNIKPPFVILLFIPYIFIFVNNFLAKLWSFPTAYYLLLHH